MNHLEFRELHGIPEPISVEEAKSRGLMPLTVCYRTNEYDMLVNVLKDMKDSKIDHAVVNDFPEHPSWLAVWRKAANGMSLDYSIGGDE